MAALSQKFGSLTASRAQTGEIAKSRAVAYIYRRPFVGAGGGVTRPYKYFSKNSEIWFKLEKIAKHIQKR
jgi:hypothetical protein